MRRYQDRDAPDGGREMALQPDGEWVYYDDAIAAIEQLREVLRKREVWPVYREGAHISNKCQLCGAVSATHAEPPPHLPDCPLK